LIRDATVADLRELTELALASKAFWGYDDAFMAACRDELTVTRELLASRTVRVAEASGTIVGFHGVARDGQDFELAWLFVAPAAMGRGTGAALLADARAVARAAGGATLTIAADPNALGFYERAGARVVGEVASESIPGRALPLLVLAVG
jgi:GNAT superfamily N-acetyltransferase